MEDLYAFLSLEPTASESEISMAYNERLFSLEETKHLLPEEQAKQMILLNKVKDILLHMEERRNYDALYAAWQRKLKNITYFVSDKKPSILHFDLTKRHLKIGDEITVTWKTTGCDQVILLPFGSVLNIGEKTIAIKTEEDCAMKFELIATNTINGLMQSASIHTNVETKTFKEEGIDESPIYKEHYQNYLKRAEQKRNSEGIKNEAKGRERIMEYANKPSVFKKMKRFFKSMFG